jgi:DNA replication protein
MSSNSPGFVGFPDQKMKPVVIPDYFFVELVPQIDDLAELKLTLHCFWLLNEQEGELRYLRGADLRTDETLLRSLTLDNDLRTPQEAVEQALQRAVARNTLLKLEIESDTMEFKDQGSGPSASSGTGAGEGEPKSKIEDWYFINTVKGRQTLALIRQGKLKELQAAIPEEARLRVQRPNIFRLYEQNVGLMTPLTAEQLRDMEKSYPPAWIEEAFEIAVSRNRRHLRYIHNILKRWETEGKDVERHEESGRTPESRGRGTFLPDDLSDIIIR